MAKAIPKSIPEYFKNYKWAQEALRVLCIVAFTIFVWGWQARGTMDDLDKRVTLTEKKISELNSEIVPRDEEVAHWNALDKRLDEISHDVRDLRKEQHDFFTQQKQR